MNHLRLKICGSFSKFGDNWWGVGGFPLVLPDIHLDYHNDVRNKIAG